MKNTDGGVLHMVHNCTKHHICKNDPSLFHDGGRYHIETRANQWSGFYMITASVMKELTEVEI